MAEERVPAGWYPDPSGLPQLRWWDNHKWTEFISDSQVEEETAEVVETVVEPVVAAVVQPETIVVSRADARAAIAQGAEPAQATTADLGQAFDAVFGGATLAPEPVAAEPEPETPRLAAAFDAAFGTAFDEHRTFEEPRVVEQPRPAEPVHVAEPTPAAEFAHTASQPLAPQDPLETLFASSATSPVGVGTGETIGEALMRALQSA